MGISRMLFCQKDFKMAHTIVPIVLLISMGTLTAAAPGDGKCDTTAAADSCKSGSFCKYTITPQKTSLLGECVATCTPSATICCLAPSDNTKAFVKTQKYPEDCDKKCNVVGPACLEEDSQCQYIKKPDGSSADGACVTTCQKSATTCCLDPSEGTAVWTKGSMLTTDQKAGCLDSSSENYKCETTGQDCAAPNKCKYIKKPDGSSDDGTCDPACVTTADVCCLDPSKKTTDWTKKTTVLADCKFKNSSQPSPTPSPSSKSSSKKDPKTNSSPPSASSKYLKMSFFWQQQSLTCKTL